MTAPLSEDWSVFSPPWAIPHPLSPPSLSQPVAFCPEWGVAVITDAGCTSRCSSRQEHLKQGGEGRYVFLRFFQILFRVLNGEIVKNIYRVFRACVRSFLRWALQGRELVDLEPSL